jgi:large subunit ribosomal protein L15
MKIKKRRKSSRFRGSQTARRGKKARTRGSGNQGGKGMSGTGKRADQKKTLVIKLSGGNNYFGKSKALRRGVVPKKLEVINLSEIERIIDFLVKQGIAKENKGFYELDYRKYKILGDGEIKTKLKIKASAASKSAIEKVKAAGGEIILEPKAEKKKEEKSGVSK